MKPTQNTVQSRDHEKTTPLAPTGNSPPGNDLGSVPCKAAPQTAPAAAESGRARVSAAVDELPGLSDLRPVGQEFWFVYPQDRASSAGEQHKFLYRVVAHDLCARFIGDEHGKLMERVEPVRMMVRYPVGIQQTQRSDGLWQQEPVFGEWQECP